MNRMDGQTLNLPPEESQSGCPNALTCIRPCIHCATTPDGGELSEVDIISIEHFLNTLAEVAMAVASRKVQKE